MISRKAMSEFREPWSVNRETHALIIRGFDEKLMFGLLHSQQDIADRIAACVSALAGVPTEDLIVLLADKTRLMDAKQAIYDAIAAAKGEDGLADSPEDSE